MQWRPKSDSGRSLAYFTMSGTQGQGNMMLAEVATPFSMASMVPTFASWCMPASST